MKPLIDAIVFDVGGTLRAGSRNSNGSLHRVEKMQDLLGDHGEPQVLFNKISAGELAYRRWCMRTLVELDEFELWRQYLLPECPPDFLRQHAITLNQLWRSNSTSRILPDAVHTIRTLADRGYRLAIISNTTSSVEAPQLLEENGLAGCFQAVLLSCTFGRRKPHPSLFLAAARAMAVLPGRCAYVGNSLSRDLVGGRHAGYGEVVIIDRQGYDPNEFDVDDDAGEEQPIRLEPDHRIGRLSELLQIYPPRRSAYQVPPQKEEHRPLYDAALSTMWWSRGRDSAAAFCAKARRLGFARIELNHQISPDELAAFDFTECYAGSVHDPCPAVVPLKQLDREDRQVASADENLRRSGVDTIRRTIDTACQLGARQVVIHPGRIPGDHSLDDRLRAMFRRGEKGTPEYNTLRDELIADRQARSRPHLDALLKSLEEIVDYARDTGLILGLENRYHYYELPIFEEMQAILSAFPQPWVGWQLDIGHIRAHENLGLMSFQQWLDHFSRRIAAVHLMDVSGLADHAVPGSGEIDYRWLSGYLPAEALRTVEVSSSWVFEALQAGLAVLEESGCISRV